MTGTKVELSNEALDAVLADIRADEISPGTNNLRHPTEDELWAHLEGAGSWLLTWRINKHLAACSRCAWRVKAFSNSCRAWEGQEGEARLRKLQERIRQAKQRELLLPSRADEASGLGSST